METTPLDLFKPALLRLPAAAKLAGMSPRAFAAACKRGEVPCELLEIGPRNRFVRAAELGAWLHGRPRI
ncbi:hypothetical protein AWV79_28210 [Cupriavidus sp. UYMMa02A]|nr:hypothetical protein AWV79_28210 [Cupriavidus sp. UYMMa02A]